MRIGNILNDSPAEVEGKFSSVIYFQGCNRDCCYCFNKDLKSFNGGKDMNLFEIETKLQERTFDGPVILTGGEPLLQQGLIEFMQYLKDKGYYVILETSYWSNIIWRLADKILFCIKTFDINERVLKKINQSKKVIPLVVVGHPCFNMDGFKKAIEILDKNVYIRYYNDSPVSVQRIYRIIKANGKKLKVFKKICLK